MFLHFIGGMWHMQRLGNAFLRGDHYKAEKLAFEGSWHCLISSVQFKKKIRCESSHFFASYVDDGFFFFLLGNEIGTMWYLNFLSKNFNWVGGVS